MMNFYISSVNAIERLLNNRVHRVLDCFGSKAGSGLAMTNTEIFNSLIENAKICKRLSVKIGNICVLEWLYLVEKVKYLP
jgi:hypothetical protein